MNQRASDLLDMVRDNKAELERTVKSLNHATTLQRRTQRELIFARKQAEKARRITEQFAANISHELRTPLNIILGFSEMMQLSPEVYGEMRWPPKLRRAVYQIYRSSRHLLDMINDILDLSRYEIVGFALNYELTALLPLIQDTTEIVEDFFRNHQVCLEVEVAEDLPTLEIDRTRIRQVLLNLLNNAQRFAEGGTVRLEARRVKNEVVISISDTGPGIPADKLSYVFDEFYQVDSSLRRSHGGTGLGLAICKRFVKAHNGRIWAESEEGGGATFSFALPLPEYQLTKASAKEKQLVEPLLSDLRAPIFVVDPDPEVAALVKRHVSGYEVIQIENSERLVEEVMLHHPQAVVYNLPPGKHADGYKDMPLPVPLIECSLPSLAWAADELGLAACLTKPITAERLLKEIEGLGNPRQVLIVDDEQGFCQLVKRMLETTDHGFVVRYAHDGEDGLLAMRTQKPDLVLLDLDIPRLDGLQVIKEMQRDLGLADIPIVLLTATNLLANTLAEHNSPLVIQRSNGLRLREILHSLRAIIDVLEPQYDERWTPTEALLAPEA
jgi:signal transduction histidine kinase/CheY-like chemotaxis protein